MAAKHVLHTIVPIILHAPIASKIVLNSIVQSAKKYLEVTEKILAAQIVVSLLYPLTLHRS